MSYLPQDVVESVLSIGPVEWGATDSQRDEQHIADFANTLRLTREHFDTEGDAALHGIYIAGSNTVVAHTGISPNSPQHARILAGAWNYLVDVAKQQQQVAA